MLRVVLVALSLIALVACGNPQATPTPTFRQFTSDRVVAAFARAGLPVTDAHPGQPWKAGDLWPNVALDRVVFTIPAIAPLGGVVQTFETPDDLAAMRAFYARLPDLAPYVYANGNALVQLGNGLSQAEAEQFNAALLAMK